MSIDKKITLSTTLLSMLFVGCNSFSESDPTTNLGNELEEVVIAVADGSTTRTELDPNDLSTVRWSVGDKVAIWATDAIDNTSTPLVGEEFTLRYYGSTYTQAEFSAPIEPMDEKKSYLYKAFYPYTSAISGTRVNYTIPTTQSGEYDGSIDFRVADEIAGAGLTKSTMGGCKLSFRSLTHALKITIPEGHNKLGVPIKELRVTLPSAAAGNLSFDMGDTTAAPTFTGDESSVFTLNLATPIDAGDGNDVWLFINPMSGVTGTLSIQGIGIDDELAYNYDIPLTNHTFSAGRITPVYTEIGEEIPNTEILITATKGNLGEELQYVHITAPAGGVFKETGSSQITIPNDGTNIYKASYLETEYNDFNGKTLTVKYESQNAIVTAAAYNITLGTTAAGNFGSFSFSKAMPYILYQNFGGAKSYEQKDGSKSLDNPGVGNTTLVQGNKPMVSLNSYGLTNWSATRVGISAKTALRICSRYQSGGGSLIGGLVGGTTVDAAQLVSPTLPYLKANAKITISYSFKGGRYSAYKSGWSWKYGGTSAIDPYGTALYSFGITSNSAPGSGVLNSADENCDLFNIVSNERVAGTYGNNSNKTQSYGGTYTSKSISTTAEKGSNSRLVWTVTNDYKRQDFGGVNGNFWLYLDNIVVTAGAKK